MDEADRFWHEWRAEADRRFGTPGTAAADLVLVLGQIDRRLARIEDFFEQLVALSDESDTITEDGTPRWDMN